MTHAGPGISIDRVRAVHGLIRIVENLDDGAGLSRNILRVGNNLRVRSVALGSGNPDRRPERGRREQQRMRHVVSVSDIGETDFLQVAEPLQQGEIVGQRLAGMFEIAERVDHRHAGVLGHSFDRAVRVCTQHDGVDPSLHIVCDVAELFARIQPARGLVHEERVAAHAGHSRFECQAGAQRLLFEEHDHLLAGECAAKICRTRLQQSRQDGK